MAFTGEINKKLSQFFNSYSKKIDFLKYLLRKKRGADEIILLTCCYIDQLGGCLFPKAGSSKNNFELMLLKHSGEKKEFSLISIGDFASDILTMLEYIEFIIPKAGRIELFSSDEIHFLGNIAKKHKNDYD